MDINALAALTSTTQPQGDKKTIAQNFDAFLNLLTTQLKHQNPLDPLDTNEFTAQLVQFSSVEQAIKTNENLGKLLALSAANSLTSAVGYIGKTITATGNATGLKDGAATWSYTLGQDAPQAKVTIRNQLGQTVFTQDTQLSAGTHQYQWDGKTTAGNIAPDGIYTISFATTNAAGANIAASTTITGVVQSVDMTGSDPELTVNGVKVKFSDVKTVSQAL